MVLIIAERKHLHAIQFPEKNQKSFLNENIAIFNCRNLFHELKSMNPKEFYLLLILEIEYFH